MRQYAYLKVKRALDVAGAATALVLAAPVLLVVALAIRLQMGPPVLFRQTRPGLNEQPFECLKFRTMNDARDTVGALLSDELRTTRLGLFLRQTSLDELPQLWNILKGDVSFIGPRPLLMSYIPYYSDTERRRHELRPGLTGWAQVHGRSFLPFDERLAMDVWYIDHVSFWLDLRILLATVWIVLTRKGFAARQPFLPLDVQRVSGHCTESGPVACGLSRPDNRSQRSE